MIIISLLRTWNCEHLIVRALAHAMSMSDAIILLDNGSEDQTFALVKRFLQECSAQRLRRFPIRLVRGLVNNQDLVGTAELTDIARDSSFLFVAAGNCLRDMGWDPLDENAEPVWICYLMPDEFISDVTYVRPWLEKVEATVVSCRRYEFWYSEQYYRGDRQYEDENVLECPEIFMRYIPGKTEYESNRVPHHIPSRVPLGLREEPRVIAGTQGFADPRMFVKHHQFWDHQKCLQKAERMTQLGDSSQAQVDHVLRNPHDESVIKLLRKWSQEDILWDKQFAQVLEAFPEYPPRPVIEL